MTVLAMKSPPTGEPKRFSDPAAAVAELQRLYSEATDFLRDSFAEIARSFGCEGVRVDKLEDVGPALRASVKAQAEGKTTVIELMCTKELGDPFRRDALQVPKRVLAKYKGFE